MKRSDVVRKLLFVYYTLKPFRFSMVKHQVMSRLTSRSGRGIGLRVVDLAVSYDCNLSCNHCSAEVLKQKKSVLDLDDYRKIVRQAETMDNLSFNITGGEPLLWDKLDDLIPVLKPEKHYISIQTNGMLLSKKRAEKLANLGVNCITTSLDSPYREIHNRFRGSGKSFDAVLSAVKHAKKAGLQVLVGTTVTHENLRSKELTDTVTLVNNMGAICLFNLAVPCGNWAGRNDVVLRETDRHYLLELMDKYPATSTDHEPGKNAKGCPAAMEKIYITAYGDVLPCPFIHLSFGNIRTDNLFDVVQTMRNEPFFKGYPKICVAAEDSRFHREVLNRLGDCGSLCLPAYYKDILDKVFCPGSKGTYGKD